MRGENNHYTIVAIVIAIVITLSGFLYTVNYANHYTPQEILDDGYVLVHRDTILGKLFAHHSPEMDIRQTQLQILSITDDIYEGSQPILRETPGVNPDQAKILARFISILGFYPDATIYLSRWFGEKYVGIDNYLKEEVFAFIIDDFNNYMMPIPWLTYIAQMLIIWGICGSIAGIALRNMGEKQKLKIKDYRGKQLAYKGLIPGDYVRATDFVSLIMALIIGPAAIIAFFQVPGFVSKFISTLIVFLLVVIVKINSPFKWVAVTGKKSKKTRLQTFTWRDKYAKKSHLAIATLSIAFFGWVLYIKQFIPEGALFNWLDLMVKGLFVIYLIPALAIRYWERFKYPGGRKVFNWRDYIPRLNIFKTSEQMIGESMRKQQAERDYTTHAHKRLTEIDKQERAKAQLEQAKIKKAIGDSYYTKTSSVGKQSQDEINPYYIDSTKATDIFAGTKTISARKSKKKIVHTKKKTNTKKTKAKPRKTNKKKVKKK